MRIKPPFTITSRLTPGVKIGEGTISIKYAHREGPRQYFRWFIDLPLPQARWGVRSDNNGEFQGDKLSAMYGSTLQEGLESLLVFLGAFAEVRDPKKLWFTTPENYDLFPAGLAEWAIKNADEIAVLALDLEEHPGEFIVE